MDNQSPLSETERKAPFQWSPQVAMIVAVTFLMLTLPLALLSVAIIQALRPVPVPSVGIAESAVPDEFRQSLERAAESLKPEGLGKENRVVIIGTDHVVEVADAFKVTAVKVEEGRYWVRLPKEQRAEFTAALVNGRKPETLPAAASVSELLEVVVESSPQTP